MDRVAKSKHTLRTVSRSYVPLYERIVKSLDVIHHTTISMLSKCVCVCVCVHQYAHAAYTKTRDNTHMITLQNINKRFSH